MVPVVGSDATMAHPADPLPLPRGDERIVLVDPKAGQFSTLDNAAKWVSFQLPLTIEPITVLAVTQTTIT